MNRTFLVTRPSAQADTLIQQIKQGGDETVLLPALNIEHFAASDLASYADSLAEADIVIFLSRNAVKAIAPIWPKHSNATLIAIGPATQAALKQYQLGDSVIPDQFDSEGIIALAILQSVSGQAIAICCGKNPTPTCRDLLTERGARVTEVVTYQRKQPHYSDQQLQEIMHHNFAGIIVTSKASLQNLCHLFHQYLEWLLQQQLIVISQSMVSLAIEQGFTATPILCKNATDQAIIDALHEIC